MEETNIQPQESSEQTLVEKNESERTALLELMKLKNRSVGKRKIKSKFLDYLNELIETIEKRNNFRFSNVEQIFTFSSENEQTKLVSTYMEDAVSNGGASDASGKEIIAALRGGFLHDLVMARYFLKPRGPKFTPKKKKKKNVKHGRNPRKR